MSIQYTVKDLLVLRRMLPTAPDYFGESSILSLDENLNDLRKTAQHTSSTSKEAHNKFFCWIREQYSVNEPYGIRKLLYKFLLEVPLEDVPLYINEPGIDFYARWRLKIAK